MIDLNTLNPEQREAVINTEGPLLILAGAGSGKTRVLTYRIAHLIEKGVFPGSILAITFTNKAAREMRERVEGLVGDEARNMWISTFHSSCVRILRQDIDKIGYNKNFVIYDTREQEMIMKDCLKELNLDDKIFPPKDMLHKIGSFKDILMDEDTFYRRNSNDYKDKRIAEIYRLYQKKLKSNNALDFDDIIMKTVRLLRENQDVLNHYQRKFRYILIDEYQDTNRAQYELVKALAEGHRNLCVVGDDDQCIAEDMKILSGKEEILVKNIVKNQEVLSAGGFGKVTLGVVDRAEKKKYFGHVIKVKTRGGKIIKATPNHIGFGKINITPGEYYVYLMYKSGKGYKIGSISGSGKEKDCFLQQLMEDNADKLWILKNCSSKGEAREYERMFSEGYGLPLGAFQGKMNGAYINTYEAASKLMEENLIFEKFPHFINSEGSKGYIVRLCSFGGDSFEGVHSHRVELTGSIDHLKEELKEMGLEASSTLQNSSVVEEEIAEYDDAVAYSKKLSRCIYSPEIIRRARLTEGDGFNYMPFAHIKPGMSVPVYDEGEIREDIVEEVEFQDYDGYVYDLSVPHLRQFVCQGVVVHNSIYGWRGADIKNILEFEEDYPETKVIKLEQNYRCTKRILEAANYVIANNEKRKQKKLWTENRAGDNIKFYRADSDREEGLFIVNEIVKLFSGGYSYRDFAILYRTNAMSRILEEVFVTSGLPYKVVGGLKFYDRKEVKDILAYLKVINNPLDSVSLERIINTPKRGIGDASIARIKEFAQEKDMSMYSGLLELDNITGLNKRALNSLDKFISLMNYLIISRETMKVSDLIEEILEKTGYLRELKEENSPESQNRIENLKELYSAAVEFEDNSEDKSLGGFLERVALVSDQDQLDESGGVTMMTLHTAKGLEYPVVFIAGVEEGIFPHFSAQEDEDEMEEERRLCYVGITRAKENLYLTCAKQRLMFGRTMFNGVSTFIEEIPGDLVDDISPKSMGFNRVYGYEDSYNSYSAPKKHVSPQNAADFYNKPVQNNISKDEIKAGIKIKHKIFGKGIVIAVKPSGNDKQITVHFDNSGLKNLLLGSAPIEIL